MTVFKTLGIFVTTLLILVSCKPSSEKAETPTGTENAKTEKSGCTDSGCSSCPSKKAQANGVSAEAVKVSVTEAKDCAEKCADKKDCADKTACADKKDCDKVCPSKAGAEAVKTSADAKECSSKCDKECDSKK